MSLKSIVDVEITLLGFGGGDSAGVSGTPDLQVTGDSVTIQGTPHNLSFTIGGVAVAATSYQWTLNNVDIAGATSSSYTPPMAMVGYLGGRVLASIEEVPTQIVANPIVLPFNVVGGDVIAESDRFIYRMFKDSSQISVRGTGSCEALLVGGGGAGGRYSGESGDPMAGGGGAGGVIFNPFAVLAGSSSPLAIVVGAGGARASAPGHGNNGADTVALGLTAFGGGGGGSNNNTSVSVGADQGGSGGGGAGGAAGSPGSVAGAARARGQGNAGGVGVASGTSTFRRGGGGGGWASAGIQGNNTVNGSGGAGRRHDALFGEDFPSVQDALGLVDAFASFAGGGGGGTGNTSTGGGGLGLDGGGNGGYNPGTPVVATSATSYGSGGGGGGDNVGTGGEDQGGSGSKGLVILAVPKVANDVKVRLWISDDTYRDDDGNPATTISAAWAKRVAAQSPLISVGGLVMGDCKVGAQWLLLHPDAASSGMPAGYNDGDTRYPNVTSNKVGGGNVWFYDTVLFPALAAMVPNWKLFQTYKENGVFAVHEWNFAPTAKSQISLAAQAIADDIIAAIQNPLPEIVVYSAGGGANVVAEAVAWITSSTNYTTADIKDHLAIIQHGRNNWFFGYDVRGGIDARVLTRQFTLAITNQNPAVYGNGWAGPSLDTAFSTSDFPFISMAGEFSSAFENAFKIAVGATAATGVPSDRTFSPTLDISDAGSHVFALCPGRLAANMAGRMLDNETLQQGEENQHLIYNTVLATSRTRVLWHGFRRSAATLITCPPA